jgi:hypothetical protein
MLIWGDAGENERVVLKHRDQLSCLEGAERKELLDELKQHCNAMYLYPGHCTQVAGIIVVNTQPARNTYTRGSTQSYEARPLPLERSQVIVLEGAFGAAIKWEQSEPVAFVERATVWQSSARFFVREVPA